MPPTSQSEIRMLLFLFKLRDSATRVFVCFVVFLFDDSWTKSIACEKLVGADGEYSQIRAKKIQLLCNQKIYLSFGFPKDIHPNKINCFIYCPIHYPKHANWPAVLNVHTVHTHSRITKLVLSVCVCVWKERECTVCTLSTAVQLARLGQNLFLIHLYF